MPSKPSSLRALFAALALSSLTLACGSGDGPSPGSGDNDGGRGGSGGTGGGGGTGGSGGTGGGGVSWLEVHPDELRVPLSGELEVRFALDRSEVGEGEVRLELGALPAGVTAHGELVITEDADEALVRFRAGEGVEALDRPTSVAVVATRDEWTGEASLELEVAAILQAPEEERLRALIDEAREVQAKPAIHFDRALGSVTIALAAPLAIDQDLELIGWRDTDAPPAITLDAEGAGRVFEIGEAEVRLVGLRIVGGSSTGKGGCILNEGELRLEEVEIADCEGEEGGGLFSNGPVSIFQSVFARNHALAHGGAAFLRAKQRIEDTTFRENHATEHGGALVSFSTLEMKDSLFRQNEALQLGGAIRIHGLATIENTNFVENEAGRHGGAISQGGDPASRLIGGTVAQNTASWDGGGIFGHQNSGLTVENTIIEENSSDAGAGVFAEAGFALRVDGSTIRRNRGAGLHLEDAAESRLRDSTVSENEAGGVVVLGTSELTILFSTISENESTDASSAGGLSSEGTTRIVSSTIAGNRSTGATGGIHVMGGETHLEFVTVAGNEGAHTGGIYWFSSAVHTSASLIADNTGGDAPDLFRNGSGSIVSGGFNLVGNLDGSHVTVPSMHASDLLGRGATPIDPLLESLADNGGQEGKPATRTMRLREGSPALNVVPEEDCLALGEPLEVDQRGMKRPVAERCDIGAFESEHIPPRPI